LTSLYPHTSSFWITLGGLLPLEIIWAGLPVPELHNSKASIGKIFCKLAGLKFLHHGEEDQNWKAAKG
jgi:hypothetical protein